MPELQEDVMAVRYTANFDWDLTRSQGQETNKRSFTIDNVPYSSESANAIRKFAKDFLTAGGMSLTAIDQSTFWQPTGWRDNDPNEEPWTLNDVTVSIVKTETTWLDPNA